MELGQKDGTSRALTVDSAQSVIEGLLSKEEEPQTRETPPARTDDPGEQPDERVEEELDPESPDASEQADDEGASEEPDEDPDPQQPQPRTFKVKVDGQDVEVTEDELLKGYSRTADYTRKTQELAQKRKQFEEAELPAVQRERQDYASRLTQLIDAIKAVTPQEPDWDTLRQQDPAAFSQTWAAWQQHKDRMQKLEAERQQAEAKVQADQQQNLQAILRAEQERLMEAVPEWKEPEKAKAGKAELVAYAKGDLGFTDQELSQVYDHRLLVMLRKAMLYDRAQQKKPAVQQTIEKVKAATPGAKPKPKSAKATEFTRRRQRLAKSGNVTDAAAAIELMLD